MDQARYDMDSHWITVCVIYMNMVVICAAAQLSTAAEMKGTRRCRPGYEPTLVSSSKNVCKPCREGYYSSHFTTNPCKPCRVCPETEKIYRQCNSTHNRYCKKARVRHLAPIVLTKKRRRYRHNQIQDDFTSVKVVARDEIESDANKRKREYSHRSDNRTTKHNMTSSDRQHPDTRTSNETKLWSSANNSMSIMEDIKNLENGTEFEVEDENEHEERFLNGPWLLISVVFGTSLIWIVFGLILYFARIHMKKEKTPTIDISSLSANKRVLQKSDYHCNALSGNTENETSLYVSLPIFPHSIVGLKGDDNRFSVGDCSVGGVSNSFSIRSRISLTPRDVIFDRTPYTSCDCIDTSILEYIPQSPLQEDLEYFDTFFTEIDSFGTPWQFQAVFDSFGGLLEKEKSAITLTFPDGSFPNEGSFSVKGSIHTEPRHVRQLLKIPDGVELASPVAEYVIAGNPHLKKHAVLRMPTCLNRSSDDVVLYCFQSLSGKSEKIALREISMRQPSCTGEGGTYYEFEDDGYINIYTRHFTGFIVCKHCNSQQDPSPPLYAAMFGRYDQQNDAHYAKLRLYIIDGYYSIKDCLEQLKQQEEEFGRVLKENKKLDFQDDVMDTSKLLIKLELANPDAWRHRLRTDGKPRENQKKIVDVKRVMRCCRRQDVPKCVEWDLESVVGVSGIQSFDCYLDILLTNRTDEISDDEWEREDDRTTITYMESELCKPHTVTENISKGITYDDRAALIIKTLTSKLTKDEILPFAREAGLSDTDIEDCNFCFHTTSMKEFKFQLLTKIKQIKGCKDFCLITFSILKKLKFNDTLEKLSDTFDSLSLYSSDSTNTLTAEIVSTQTRNSPDGATLDRNVSKCPVEETECVIPRIHTDV